MAKCPECRVRHMAPGADSCGVCAAADREFQKAGLGLVLGLDHAFQSEHALGPLASALIGYGSGSLGALIGIAAAGSNQPPERTDG